MPSRIVGSCVDVSCAPHEPKSSHNAEDQANLWEEPENLKICELGDLSYPEMVDEPAEYEQRGSRNGAKPEDDVSWVVASCSANPAVRKRRLLSEVNGYNIAQPY